MSNHQDVPTDLNEFLRQAKAVLLTSDPPAPPVRKPEDPRPQINRNPVPAWWRDMELGKELFRYNAWTAIFGFGFGFCAFISREPNRYGFVAHVLAGLLNPIPLALAISALGMMALVRRQFQWMTLAVQLLVAYLIAIQIVSL